MFRFRTAASAVALGLMALATHSPSLAQDKTLSIVWMGWPDEHVKPMMDAFMAAHPDITVNYERVPFNQIFQTLDVRLNARTPDPDVYSVDSPLTASYAVRGHLLDLTDVIDVDKLTPAARAAAQYDGKIYSAPIASSSALLFYNKALLDAAGIPHPSTDPAERMTWEAVVEGAKSIRDEKAGVWGLVIEQSERPYQLLPMAQSLGATGISDDGLTAAGYVDSPEFVEAATFYRNLFNEWRVSPTGVFDHNLSQELFGTGKTGFFIGGPWMLSILANYPDLDWGVAPFPYFEKGRPVTPTGSWHVGINPRTDAMDAARTFVNWYLSDAAQQEWFKLRSYPPVTSSMWELEAQAFDSDGWQIMRHELDETAVARPATPGWREYEDILRVAFRDIQTGEDPQTALTRAATQIDRELVKYR